MKNKDANKITPERRKYLLERRSEILTRRDEQVADFNHRAFLKRLEERTEFLIRNGYPYKIVSRASINWIYENFPRSQRYYLEIDWYNVPDSKDFYVPQYDSEDFDKTLEIIKTECGLGNQIVVLTIEHSAISYLELKAAHLFEWVRENNFFRNDHGLIACPEEGWAIEFEEGYLYFGYAPAKENI